jgi:hypothetical protein
VRLESNRIACELNQTLLEWSPVELHASQVRSSWVRVKLGRSACVSSRVEPHACILRSSHVLVGVGSRAGGVESCDGRVQSRAR